MYCFQCDCHSASKSRTCEKCGRPLETDPDRYFKAGMEAMVSGAIDRSIMFLKDCVTLAGDHLSGLYNLGIALCMAGEYDEANEQFAVVMEQDPDFPGVCTAMGQAAFGLYLYHSEQAESSRKRMIKLFANAIEQDPDDVDAHFSMGNAYMAAGRPGKAIPWLQNALKLQSDTSAIYFALAKAYKAVESYPDAITSARKAAEFSKADDPLAGDIARLLSELEHSGNS